MINCINTASALLSRYAANTAHRKLNVQTPTEAKSGGPKLWVLSYIIGVKKLFRALPSSGIVIARPRAKASYFPTNQNETKLA
jgi:hypothetical protein